MKAGTKFETRIKYMIKFFEFSKAITKHNPSNPSFNFERIPKFANDEIPDDLKD